MPKYTALTLPSDGEIDALIDTKMRALFAHYGLDSTDALEGGPKMATAWANLAWHLARQHVPGFIGAPRGRGRPATRKQDDVTIVMHVELLKRRDGLSERKARILAKRLLPEVRGLLRDGRIAGLDPKLRCSISELNVRVRSTRGLSGSNAPYARFESPRARSRQPLGRRRPRRARARRSSPRAGACRRRPAPS
jgi:hypothetical protein